MMKKGSLELYILFGLFIGFLIAVFGRSMPARFIAPTGIALGAMVLFMYADRMSGSNKKTNKENTMKSEEIEILPPDEAREWLDDFLVKQQGDK